MASGTTAIVRNGQTLPAPLGAEVFESDVLRTGTDGRLAVMLRDETRVSLGPDSEVALASFAFSPSDSQMALTLKLARGVLSYVSGLVAKLAPAAVSIQTPTAIIGVRGTHALVRAGAAVTAACLRSGLALVLMAALTGCARPQPQTQPAPPPPPRDVVALAPDPESGEVGALTVRTPAGEVTLDSREPGDHAHRRPGAERANPAAARRDPAAVRRRPWRPCRRRPAASSSTSTPATSRSPRSHGRWCPTSWPRSRIGRCPRSASSATPTRPAAPPPTWRSACGGPTLIRDQLVAAGLDTRLVEVTSHGETNPVVPTPDNTAEARNRRVEVTVR